MSGSALAALPEGFAVCDIAVPLRPHRSSAIEVLATARLVTKSDETLMAMSSHVRDRQFHPRTGRYQVPGLCQFQFEPPEIETSQHRPPRAAGRLRSLCGYYLQRVVPRGGRGSCEFIASQKIPAAPV